MKHKMQNSMDSLYQDAWEVDSSYGGKKLRRVESDLHKKRPVRNLKKAWEEHEEDYDEIDDFYEH